LYPIGSFKSHALTTEDAVIETADSIITEQLSADYPVRMPLMCSRPTEISGDCPANMNSFIRELAHVKFDSPYQFEKVIMLEMRRMQRTGGTALITPRLNSRVIDQAAQLKTAGMSVCVCWITDSRREEANVAISRLKMMGIMAFKIDPWGQGLGKKQMIEEKYGMAR
ncbi:MAG: hypothetical protein Q4D04_13080, partial [Clostridia bacterium]|nr:hypothetical protein [Clostridia bacterium]